VLFRSRVQALGEADLMLHRFHIWILCGALWVCAASVARAQSTAEYGAATSASGTAAANAKVPIPKMTLPGANPAPSAAGKPATAANSAAVPSAKTAAANNRLALERQAGPDAPQVTLRSVPDHALVWIDMQYVGAAPMTLKLAPSLHHVRMALPGIEPRYQDLDLTSKQTKEIVISLAAADAANPTGSH
jgi:hypothetical protein